jgi:cyclic pyranopterin phosphate synthase
MTLSSPPSDNILPPDNILIDPYQRAISYLRVSVTDRCDFRCTYCMAENMAFLPKSAVLSLEELSFICGAFIKRGVRKLRLTGGEPLVRRNIMWLFDDLSKYLNNNMLDELTLTTNASQLHKYAQSLYDVGVRRVNVSLDTLCDEKFKKITRWGRLSQVLGGIDAAKKAGLNVKINCVALKNVNSDEIFSIIEWCADQGHDLTFIEVMPLGDVSDENMVSANAILDTSDARLHQYWPLSLLRAHIAQKYTLQPSDKRSGGPARYFTLQETGQNIGFITPLTHNFCEDCNRVRLTCQGELYMCLGQEDKADFKKIIRAFPGDIDRLNHAIDEAISRKPKGHDFIIDRRGKNIATPRHMSVTGG